MKQGGVAFLAGGTGHPYFSTDTATVLRAVELDCDIILNAKAVDGVYDSDPKLNPQAKKYDEIPFQEVLDKKLGVIDLAATVLSVENKMPMLLFGLAEENSIIKAAQGKSNGTTLTVSK
jgi:uridylate kinase